MEAMRALEVSGLSCSYADDPVLNNVSFSLKPGKALAIVGPSCSGKTTLAYCISGIIPNRIPGKVRGSIKVDGVEMLGSRIEEITRHVGFVLQNYELQIFGLTVEEDIELSSGCSEEEKVGRILTAFGLDAYRKHFVHELSGGLKHRLVITSTVLSDVKYLVMDDPTANIDWKGKRMLAKTISMLKDEGKGILLLGKRLKGLEDVIDDVIELPRKPRRDGIQATPVVERTQRKEDVPAISFEDVWFKYSRDYVLKSVNIKIGMGEVVSVMGPNGSGKTTMMKLTNGLLKPTKGRVLILGMDTKDSSPSELARYVGTVFQDPDRYITFDSVWDEVTFGPRNLGMGNEHAGLALEMLGLSYKKHEIPYSLSMGEKIRLSIASAIAMNPEIILMDEPTTGQDEETLSQLVSIIQRLKLYGKTILIITHDTDFALQVSDRVVILREESIVYDGNPIPILEDLDRLSEWELEPPSKLSESLCLAGKV